ncbi:MAG: hypothetical protein ACOH2N_01320 [Devosia sp.]
MTHFPKLATSAVAALALIASAGAAFAATSVTTAEPGAGMAINDFKSQLAVFNPSEVTDLVGAKAITVIKFDTAWNGQYDGSDKVTPDTVKALNLLTTDAPQIAQLRDAITANSAAAKILAANNIPVNNLVDIVSDGAGNVQLYVS